MSQTPPPSRRDLLRPIEMLGGAAIGSIFVGLIVLMVTREVQLAAIAFGVVFIVVLVALAMFALVMKPDAAEFEEIAEEDREGH
ncbi:hypothetical protein [Glaciibacter flavus]|uniref:hypothetical protein n=1 Tax=Orlajensenia flava TaxID=2565934 RepID=UPI003AFF99B4